MKGAWIPYSAEQLAWIEARQTMPRRDLHAAFCAAWHRTDVSQQNLTALCKRKGWVTGRTGQFVKGQVSHNKGVPMSAEVRAKVLKTAFRKGNRPHTYKGAGHERIDNKDGYVVMIVDEVNPWTGAATRPVFKHRWLWEQEHGPIPEGMALKCLDGDKTNCAPSNWELIPRGMLPRLNNRWGRNYDTAEPDVKPALMTIARIEQRIDDIKGGDT